MTKQQIIDEQRQEIRFLRCHIADYKHRHDLAINALADLAAGYGITVQNRDWHHSMQEFAKNKLAMIAKLPLREAP